jgi:hypothetical protein
MRNDWIITVMDEYFERVIFRMMAVIHKIG